ncbi:MAG: right-handed parallel beta-helix repeat-containing protein [Pirellulales bacterium]
MARRFLSRRALRQSLESLEQRLALTTFYVAPGGSDAASGATDAPWQTLQHAADLVVPGDVVIARTGHYAGFDLDRDGTAAARITFRGEGQPVIDRPNARTPDGINLEGADYITIEGFKVVGQPRAGIRSVVNENVEILNNVTDQNGRWGIFTGFSDDLLIEGNVCTNSFLEHGIYVSNSGDRPVIRGNTVYGNHANGIHMNGDESQGGDGVISGALVENNLIYDNGSGGGSAINADGVQNSRIQNNLIYDNHASGISLYRIDGGGPSTGNVVANNTVVQADDARWALNIRDGSADNTVINNIFLSYHSYRGAMSVAADSLPGLESDYNAVIDRFTTDDGDSRLTLAEWRAATGQDAHSFVAPPEELFVNVNDDFSLKYNAPAVDAGTANQAPPTDYRGAARPRGAANDIGAFEYVPPGPSLGDANEDGRIDLTDFGILKANFGQSGGWTRGDFNGNGRVDLTDFGLLKNAFGLAGALNQDVLLGLAMDQARRGR